jgi:four helix bundle protein
VEEKQKELGFETLNCYKLALKLLTASYKLSDELPAYERFNLADQLRRSALSILLNIAEGYGRYHYLDKLRFFYFARGSLCETLSSFIAASSIGYITDDQLKWVRETENEAEKALNGYIHYIREQQFGKTEYGSKFVCEYSLDYNKSDQVYSNEELKCT